MIITRQQWQQAQIAEREQHNMPMEKGIPHYARSYWNYAKYVGLENVNGIVCEIGPADYPALTYYRATIGIIIEPMPSPILEQIVELNGFTLIKQAVEDIELPRVDEIWILNLLQHVIDPDLLIEKCKAAANIIRYFEPINTGVCTFHPHTFTLADFERWFGTTNYYNDKIPGFHQAECAYGVWEKTNNNGKSK